MILAKIWMSLPQNVMTNTVYKKLMENKNYFPIRFQIQTINTCNGKCIMCPYKKENKIRHMDNKLFEKIIKEIADESESNGSIELVLQNEPFLDSKFIDKIRFIKKHNLPLYLSTNGSLLNKEIIRKLEKLGIDSLAISLDSINKKTFEEIRAGLDFMKIMQNIELLKNSNLKNKVKIRMVIQTGNDLEIEDFINFWVNRGLKPEIREVVNRCGTLKNFDDIKSDIRLNKKMKSFFYGVRKSLLFNFCLDTFYKFNILSNGNIIFCCHDWKHEDILGNVQENTIKEIWNSKIFREYRMFHLTGQAYKIKTCKDCSLLICKKK